MFDERFARQYRYEPPPEFPLASPYTGIDHHLSGANRYAPTQTTHLGSWSVDAACFFSFLLFSTKKSKEKKKQLHLVLKKKIFTFIAPSGFPPYDSHTC